MSYEQVRKFAASPWCIYKKRLYGLLFCLFPLKETHRGSCEAEVVLIKYINNIIYITIETASLATSAASPESVYGMAVPS